LPPIVSSRPSAGHLSLASYSAERRSDAQLVDDVALGDELALGVVWDRYSKLVRNVLLGAIGTDGTAEDLLQEVFLAFHRGAKQIHDGSALRGYLVGVAVRLAAMELRRRRVRRWVGLSATGELPDTPVAPQDVEGRESLRALLRVLDQVSTRRRLAFVLRHVQGFEILEVASALEVSESTARRELTRARQQLALLARREPALRRYLRGEE
jgi:RNA polymerase sigma-70 factor (ECF subfamily)